MYYPEAVFTNNVKKHIQHYVAVLKTEAIFTNNVGNIYHSICYVLYPEAVFTKKYAGDTFVIVQLRNLKKCEKKKLHTIFTYVLYCNTTTICKSGLKQELFDENSISFCLIQRVLTYFFFSQTKERA